MSSVQLANLNQYLFKGDAFRRTRVFLFAMLLLFSFLSLSLLFLLHRHISAGLEAESLFRFRALMQEVLNATNVRIDEALRREMDRPFEEYSFFSVASNSLLQHRRLQLSPLSQVPFETAVPGLIGYFQIAPDQSFHSPIMPDPEIAPERLKALGYELDLKGMEYRIKLWNEMRRLVSGNQLLPDVQEANVATDMSQEQVIAKLSTKDVTPKVAKLESERKEGLRIRTFEGTVDPFQMRMLPSGQIAFFRKAQHTNGTYVQGFVVETVKFLNSILAPAIDHQASDTKPNMYLMYRGTVLWTSNDRGIAAPVAQMSNVAAVRQEKLLLDAKLTQPLNEMVLFFTFPDLPEPYARNLMTRIVLLLALVWILGAYGIYYLASRHLALAQERGDFVSAVTHELKTPLTSIRLFSEMLLNGVVPDEAKREEYYAFIHGESERLSRLITKVLNYASISQGKEQGELASHSVKKLLHDVRDATRALLERDGFELVVLVPDDFTESSPRLVTDHDAFVQIFVNVIENAAKFASGAARKVIELEVSLSEESEGNTPSKGISFYVRDFGPGIPSDHAHRLFEAFYRAEDESTRASQGTGIGLAIVKGLAERLGAHVSLKNHAGGAEFSLSFAERDFQHRNDKPFP